MKTILILLGLLAASNSMAVSESNSIDKIKSKLGFIEGNYSLQKGGNKNCPSDIVDLAFETANDSFVLRLGEKIIFSELNQEKYKEATDVDCESDFKNTLALNQLTQVKDQQCKDVKKNHQQTMEIRTEKNKLIYSFKKIVGKKTVGYSCEYMSVKK
jgi:hypothetical protein